jgi:hypothetical protein
MPEFPDPIRRIISMMADFWFCGLDKQHFSSGRIVIFSHLGAQRDVKVWKGPCEQWIVCGGAALDKTKMLKWYCSQEPSDVTDILSLIYYFDYFPKVLNKFRLSNPNSFMQSIFDFMDVRFIVFTIRSVSFVVLDIITDYEKSVTRRQNPEFTLFLHLDRTARCQQYTVIGSFNGLVLSRRITVSRNRQSARSRPRFHFTFCNNSQVMERKYSRSWIYRSSGHNYNCPRQMIATPHGRRRIHRFLGRTHLNVRNISEIKRPVNNDRIFKYLESRR